MASQSECECVGVYMVVVVGGGSIVNIGNYKKKDFFKIIVISATDLFRDSKRDQKAAPTLR